MILIHGSSGKTGSTVVCQLSEIYPGKVLGIDRNFPVDRSLFGIIEDIIPTVVYISVSSRRPYDESCCEEDNASLDSFLHLLRESVRRFKFIFFSSIALYNEEPAGFCDPDFLPFTPVTPYVRHKCYVERRLRAIASNDYRVAILRFGALLTKPLTDETFLASAWRTATRGETPTLVCRSNRFNACIDRSILPKLLLRVIGILDDEFLFSTNVGCNHSVSMFDISTLLAQRFDFHPLAPFDGPNKHVPERELEINAKIRDIVDIDAKALISSYFDTP